MPLCIFGQADPSTELQKKSYPKVIAEYIKALSGISNLKYDTLFIGKHEEFPNISLPAVIQEKKIQMLDSQKPSTGVEKRESFILINIAEMKLTNESAKFILVTFFKGYRPQHNMYIELKYNPTSSEYELDKEPKIEYSYSK